jgi:hypothetical protein
VGAWSGERALKREKDLEVQGLIEVRISGNRTLGKDEQARDAGVGIFALGILAGLAVGAAGFFISGGRLSTEHARGFSSLGR